MLNSKLPDMSELPTTRQLVGSTLLAMGGAAAILVAVVMPSEYGIDPTGLGGVLGLTEMGEIKTQLAEEAAADRAADDGTITGPAQPTPVIPQAAVAARNDTMTVTLAPGEAAEIKVSAAKGASISFDWAVSGGNVNYDTHGDPVVRRKGFYHGYGKGKASTGEKGTLVTAFDGTHGWYWRNRSDGTVTVVLKTTGAYTDIKRVV
ncbi:MAG: transmembrane anchor protein [Sphingobium sp.]|nr:MAG: transmembrane anchor protein [Sphingobium sp.]